MNNFVHSKTMENVRNKINFKLFSSEKKASAIVPGRIKHTIFNDNLVGADICKQDIKLTKLIYIGQSVLD